MSARNAGRRLLLLLVMAVALLGCGRIEAMAMIEGRPADVEEAPGCQSEKAPRGWQYRSQLDMGEVPPSRAKKGKKSYIGRTQVTKELESGFSAKSAFLIGEILFLIVGAFLLMVAIGVLFNKEATPKRKLVLMGVAMVSLLVATGLGYAAGSVVSLDNPTDRDLAIVIDGEKVVLPAGKFTNVRVVPTTVQIETESDGELVEQLSMVLDDGIGETLFRSTLGDGRYIYSVCGTTKYHLRSARYE